jgi:5-dehydro-2-deoxygluconokinase
MSVDLDLISIGRAAVDLYGEQIGSPLEDVQSFDKSVGGSAANIAIGSARQGLRVAMLTRVGDEHMGRFVRRTLEREGIDVSHVATDPERLTALVLLSVAGEASFPLIFYRENCADMALDEADFDAAFIGRAKAVLVTGTHLSTEKTRAACAKAICAAKAAGGRVVLDVDYRPVLWRLTGPGLGEERFVSSARVTAEMAPFLADCDLIVGTEEEIQIAGGSTDLVLALASIRRRSAAVIVMKRGARGCVLFDGPIPASVEEGLVCRGRPVDVLNVLGAGDAFMSGFLRGWIPGDPLERCAELANGMGALVVSRHTCSTAMPTRAELDLFLARGLVPEIEAIHRTTYRRPIAPELTILAFDHRRQIEELGGTEDQIRSLKVAVADAAAAAAERTGARGPGVIIDAEYGAAALARMSARGDMFVARPIEGRKTRPVSLIGAPNVELELLTWPSTQVVKCLVHCHPSDEASLASIEIERLVRLQSAVRRLRREWLLEVIPEAGGALDLGALGRSLSLLAGAGLAPDYWKLPDPPSWSEIEAIAGRDPHCRGVLLLGLAASEDEIGRAFDRAPPFCRGFAIGRTIWSEPARRFFAGETDRAELMAEVSTAFERLIARWQSRRR